MSQWLDFTENTNRITQSYFNGFVDVSGGGVYIRSDNSLNFYDMSNLTVPRMSIKSDTMRVYDGVSTYYDISNTQLIYIKDVSSNVQSQINAINNTISQILAKYPLN